VDGVVDESVHETASPVDITPISVDILWRRKKVSVFFGKPLVRSGFRH